MQGPPQSLALLAQLPGGGGPDDRPDLETDGCSPHWGALLPPDPWGCFCPPGLFPDPIHKSATTLPCRSLCREQGLLPAPRGSPPRLLRTTCPPAESPVTARDQSSGALGLMPPTTRLVSTRGWDSSCTHPGPSRGLVLTPHCGPCPRLPARLPNCEKHCVEGREPGEGQTPWRHWLRGRGPRIPVFTSMACSLSPFLSFRSWARACLAGPLPPLQQPLGFPVAMASAHPVLAICTGRHLQNRKHR